MSLLNTALRTIFDGFLFPFRGLPPLVGLVVVSLIAAVGMLLVFKATSNQQALADVKRRIHAGFFEIRLFNDDLRAILRAQLGILRTNLTYLRLSCVPMFWMIVPLVVIIIQLQFHYGYRGLEPGESALLTVELAAGNPVQAVPGSVKPDIVVEAPDGVRVHVPGVWVSSKREMTWRVTAERPGDYELQVEMGGESYAKTVTVSDAVIRRSPIRPDAGFLRQVVWPAESPLPKGSPIRSIALSYPDAQVELGVFGWRAHWLVVFFVLSIVFAFALRNRFGVTI